MDTGLSVLLMALVAATTSGPVAAQQDARVWRERAVFPISGTPVLDAGFSADGSLVVTLSEKNEILARRVADGATVGWTEVVAHRFVSGLGVTADGRFAVTGGCGLHDLQTHERVYGKVAEAVDSHRVLEAGHGTETQSAELQERIAVNHGEVERVVAARSGEAAVAWRADGSAFLWRPAGVLELDEHADRTHWLTFSADGRHVAWWHAGHLFAVDLESDERVGRPWPAARGNPRLVPGAVGPEVYVVDSGGVRAWNTALNRVVRDRPWHELGLDGIVPTGLCAVAPDGVRIAVPFKFNLAVVDFERGTSVAAPIGSPNGLAWSPDGTTLVTTTGFASCLGSSPFVIHLLDPATLSERARFGDVEVQTDAVAWLPGSRELLAGSAFGTAWVDAENGKTLGEIEDTGASLAPLATDRVLVTDYHSFQLVERGTWRTLRSETSKRTIWRAVADRAGRSFALACEGSIRVFDVVRDD